MTVEEDRYAVPEYECLDFMLTTAPDVGREC